MFAKLAQLSYRDPNDAKTKAYSEYNKEKYRQYIKDPGKNAKNLRDMSRFFYIVSSSYRRLCKYYAEIPLLYWTLTPQIDMEKPQDEAKVMKSYHKALKLLNSMNMQHEFRKLLTVAWREDACFGYIYSSKGSWMIDILDPDYCKIVQIEDGCYNFAFNFEYFDKNAYRLDYIDAELKSAYNKYKKDGRNYKWQILNPKKTICIKINEESPFEIIPPMVGIFEDLIDLIDYRSLIRNREEIQNYVLLLQKVPVFEKQEGVDNFMLDGDTVVGFDSRLQEIVPEQVGVVTSPMDIEAIQFKGDTPESDVISKATRNMFDNAGTSQMLFNSEKSGKVGLDASVRTDEMLAFDVMRQLERWVRRYIKQNVSGIEFTFNFLDISHFNRQSFIDRQIKLAQIGVPNKLILCAANGDNPLQTVSSLYVENDIMKLHEKFIPVSSSYTMSSKTDKEAPSKKGGNNLPGIEGRPQKDDDDLSDGGAETRDDGHNTTEIET